MLNVAVAETCVSRGQTLTVIIKGELPWQAAHVNIHVATCGVPNPAWVMSADCQVESVDSGLITLKPLRFDQERGFYEITHVVLFHGIQGSEDMKSYRCGADFVRVFFEVVDDTDIRKTRDQLREVVTEQESSLRKRFQQGVVVPGAGDPGVPLEVLCFVSGILITRPFVMGGWEVFPFHGLDGQDRLNLINDFLRTKSRTGVSFPPSDMEQRRKEQPVLVAHFPRVVAANENEALNFCTKKVQILAEVFSYTRQASGDIFGVLVLNQRSGSARLLTVGKPYAGNLLGGEVAGENPDDIVSLSAALETDAQLRYFVSLYKEARGEEDLNYQYLRHWQLMETIAESRNYNKVDDLRDLSGAVILTPGGKPRKMRLATSKVYRVLQVPDVQSVPGYPPGHPGCRYTLMDFVERGYAMRNATAHFGGFRRGEPTQIAQLDCYAQCENVFVDQGNATGGFVLEWLRSASRTLLALEIRSRGVWSVRR